MKTCKINYCGINVDAKISGVRLIYQIHAETTNMPKRPPKDEEENTMITLQFIHNMILYEQFQ